ncbi:MAG TPA: AraC family transcriptional regulator [Burkholderiales bacterium]|nr:AraC family transcriptional regulator [Burkholderiales bacterium]
MLFEGEFLRLGHVIARPPASRGQPLEHQDCDVLVLPLAGLFAKHDGPRRQVIGTPSHAVFIQAGKPYRISYPGSIGDECLTIRFSAAALPAAGATHTLLPPPVMLARSLLWRRFADGAWDPLEVEELALDVLLAALGAARTDRGRLARRELQAERVKEAISLHPERKWKLSELARLAGVSHWHLARVFRAQVGESVYRYVLRARLAKSLDAVLDGADLTATALESGFSSHSHFTARFRSLFGVTPAQLRQAAGSRTLAELRKIVTAGTFVWH